MSDVPGLESTPPTCQLCDLGQVSTQASATQSVQASHSMGLITSSCYYFCNYYSQSRHPSYSEELLFLKALWNRQSMWAFGTKTN